MSTYSEFFPQGAGSSIVPGILIDVLDNYIGDDTNFINVTDGVTVNRSLHSDLDLNLRVPDRSNMLVDQIITNATPLALEHYGDAIAVSDNILAIGTKADEPVAGLSNQGTVDIYNKVGGVWVFSEQIVSSVPNASGYFGSSISIDSNTMVIGEQSSDTGALQSGAVHVYINDSGSWVLQQVINNPFPELDDRFGGSVDIHGEYIVVGAFYDNTAGVNAGAAHVYIRSGATWTKEVSLYHPTPGTDDSFGISVSIYDSTVIVGAKDDNVASNRDGSAHIFVRSGTTWSLQQSIVSPSANISVFFGNIVSIYGETIAIAAPGDTTNYDNDGSVYVYTRSGTTWSLQQKIANPNPGENDMFGSGMSLYSDTLGVGKYGTWVGTGGAHLLERVGTTWSVTDRIISVASGEDNVFGCPIAVYKDEIVISAPGDDLVGNEAGAVYVMIAGEANTFYIQSTDQALKLTK